MSQVQRTQGTTPYLAFNERGSRAKFSILFIPSSIVAGNTGRIHVGKGFVPTSTLAAPNQGDVLNAGASIEEKEDFPSDDSLFRGQVWVIASAADQEIILEQILKE